MSSMRSNVMNLPSLRNKISISTGNRNSSLKSILSPTGEALEVLSVEAIDAPLHNTKITVSLSYKNNLDEGSNDVKGQRAILYNRLNLNQVIPEDAVLDLTDIVKTIKLLNTRYQCDFTEDDLEIVDGILRAKTTSLGYYGTMGDVTGGVESPVVISCDGALPQTELYLNGLWDVEIDGEVLGSDLTKDEVFRLINPFQNNQ